jgi:tRNA-2-methylthio-N6-dimethylallyladenosine synthase
LDHEITYENVPPVRKRGSRAWIAITRGCDNFCSYCIVPFVRGRLRSRSFTSIVDEARRAVDAGFKEIVLLGQNVNAYSFGEYDFLALLRELNGIEELCRIRFTTSHPGAMNADFIEQVAVLEKVCHHLHLPLQSGSDKILKRMNRGYNVGHYLKIIEAARMGIDDINISTDILVGFPGEKADDHRETLRVMKTVRFDSAFMFRYSAREGTKAAGMEDDVPDEEKALRLEEVISLQKDMTLQSNRREIGKVHRVLIERTSRKKPEEVFGRTFNFKGVVLPGTQLCAGDEVDVLIQKAYQNTLRGIVIFFPSAKNSS